MPNNVLYYDYLIKLCNATGDFVNKRALYNDIMHGDPTSPESIKTLAKYYDGDKNILATVYKRVRNEAGSAWNSVKELLQCCDHWVPEDADVFGKQLAKVDDDCDFRAKVRDWARAELKREKKQMGSSTFYDMRALLDRYQKLVLKRQGKK